MPPRPPSAAEPPPRIAPLPDAGWATADGAPADTFDHAEPPMPEPPPRPARPAFADEVRRPAPPPRRSAARRSAGRTSRRNRIGAAPEPRAPRPSRRCADRCRASAARSEPPDAARRRAPANRRSAAAGAARPNAPPHRRRHRPPPPHAAGRSPAPTRISPRWRSGWKPRCAVRPSRAANRVGAPPVAPEPPQAAAPAPRSERARRPPPAPQKSGFRKSRRRDGEPAGPSEEPFVRPAKSSA